MVEESHIRKFAAVCAEAVLTFLDSRETQWVAWDGHSDQFEFGSVELDPPAVPVVLLVNEDWERLLGDVAEITNPESPDFDAEALRRAIEAQLVDEGFGERLLKLCQERLLKRERAGDDEEPEEDGA